MRSTRVIGAMIVALLAVNAALFAFDLLRFPGLGTAMAVLAAVVLLSVARRRQLPSVAVAVAVIALSGLVLVDLVDLGWLEPLRIRI